LRPDASKIALAHLVALCKMWDFDMIDAQIPSQHLARLGAVEVPRDRFVDELARTQTRLGQPGKWCRFEEELKEWKW